MVAKIEEKDSLFLKCKQSVLEIVGWKSFIFLPQNYVWRYFIIITVILTTMTNITSCFHKISFHYADIIRLSCGIGYFVDAVLATMHYAMRQTRKLRHGRKRHAILLILDFFSLLPFTVIFGHLIYKIEENPTFSCYLYLNQYLRIYQVPKSFWDMKRSIYKVRTYIIVTFLEVLSYLLLLTYILSCFIVLGYDAEEKMTCENDIINCISINYIITFGVFGQLFISPFREYSLNKQKILLLVYYMVGYLFTYAYLFPLALFMSLKYLVKSFKISLKWIHLKVWLQHMINDKKLKGKILNQIHCAWMYGKGDQWPEILSEIPLSFRKNIFCDMHWEAIRHSQLFHNLSMGCKRSLALCMTTEFLVPETVVLKETEINYYFIYIESGTLQIMCLENSESPLVNLSSGTVLGEMSLFLQVKSKATLRVAQLSAVHFLHFRDFFRVLADYPNDMKTIIHKMKMRLGFAKSLYINKTKISPQFSFEGGENKINLFPTQGHVKWLKEQYRALFEVEKADKLRKINFSEDSVFNYQQQLQKLKTQLDHTSLHFPQISINDSKINKVEAVCVKVSFPWVMNPDCNFFRVWNYLVFFVVIFTALLYPPVIGWVPILPQWFSNISVVVSIINIADVLMQLITAVKIKNIVISKFSAVLVYRSTTPEFWTDILAALPLQFFISSEIKNTAFAWNLYFLNVLLKAYKLISITSKWSYGARPGAFIRVCVKYLFFFIVFLTWSAAMFNFIIDDWEIYKNSEWYVTLKESTDLPLSIVASFAKALFTVFKIPESETEKDFFLLFFVSSFFSNFFHLYLIVMISECIAVYVMESIFELEYKNSMKFIYDFMGKKNIKGRLRSRVIETMSFQLDYEKGNNGFQRHQIIDYLSIDLKKEIIQKSLIQDVANSRLFELEEESFHLDLCRKAVPFVVPKNSVLLTFGAKPMALFLIQKGFIQINSFISQDLHMNISTPVVIKEGDIFPVIDAFSQNPSAVTAIAITECKLIQLDLEDVISTMVIHGVLRDLVEAVKETNLSALSSAKLGVSVFEDDYRLEEKPSKVPPRKLKYLKFIQTLFLLKKAINSQSGWYVRWEISRIVFILIGIFFWPIVFGFSASSDNLSVIIIVLFSIDCTSWLDFYIRLHTAYYNKVGICITNTLSTSFHYLSASFIADIIAFAPNFHLVWFFSQGNYDFDLGVIIIHLLMRSFSFYRIVGFFRYLNQRNVFYKAKLVRVFLFTIIGVHYYVNIQLYIYFKRMADRSKENPRIDFDRYFKYYLTELGLVISMILKNVHHFDNFKLIDLMLTVLFAIFGFFLRIYIYGNITLWSMVSDKKLNFYQYYMKSFIQYLNHEKAPDKLLNFVTEYFKNDWNMERGNNLNEIFAYMPRTLHEDIAHSLYKKTFKGVGCFSNANESFFRILSRNVRELSLQKGSMIIYKNQVQENIFFIHKGKCFVKNLSQILYRGSVIGDIEANGIMKSTIVAKTNVQLLRIASRTFFMALNNFHYTKMAFLAEAAQAESFLPSIYIDQKEDPLEILRVDDIYDKSNFIPEDDDRELVHNYFLKKKRYILNPQSLTAFILDYFFLTMVYLTLFFTPIFIVFRIFSPISLCIIYFLDLVWVAKIALNFRTAFYDEKTGNLVYDKKAIRRRYMRLRDGFIAHFLSVLPLEIFPFLYFGLKMTDECCSLMTFFYMNRLIRGTFILTSKKEDETKLVTNFLKGLFKVMIMKLVLINFCVSFDILLKDFGKNLFNKCHWDFEKPHQDAIITSYLWVVNVNIDKHHHESHQSDQYIQSFFRMLLSICAFMSKVFLLNEVLKIMIVNLKIHSDEMLKLEHLEDYLLVRDVSPILFKRTRKYFCNLINSFYECAEPFYLRTAPTFIKAKLMQEFYTNLFLNCYPFQGIQMFFLKQLAERLERCIFFPGDYITEKGDVDHNMYFIHKGEVSCVETDKNIRGLENPVKSFYAGQNFGVLQGILPAYPHIYTYRAKTLSDVMVLNYHRWRDLRIAFPDIALIIHQNSVKYESFQKTQKDLEDRLTVDTDKTKLI